MGLQLVRGGVRGFGVRGAGSRPVLLLPPVVIMVLTVIYLVECGRTSGGPREGVGGCPRGGLALGSGWVRHPGNFCWARILRVKKPQKTTRNYQKTSPLQAKQTNKPHRKANKHQNNPNNQTKSR